MTITIPGWLITLVLILVALGIGILLPDWIENPPFSQQTREPEEALVETATQTRDQQVAQVATATETLLPATPLSSRTPTNTLRPPPTLEAPTNTPAPSATPSITPTQRFSVNVTVPGIQGLPEPTTETEEACEPRADWTLRYEVQVNDTLTSIAEAFGTNIYALAEGNCLEDPDTIIVGQQLRVPGEALPETACNEPWEVLTPINYAWGVPYSGQIVFNWRGPRAYRNLVRLYPPGYFTGENEDTDEDGDPGNDFLERTVDLRQNQTWDLSDLPEGGEWRWQVFPLDVNFQQICPESPIWIFTKEAEPTPVPSPTLSGGIIGP